MYSGTGECLLAEPNRSTTLSGFLKQDQDEHIQRQDSNIDISALTQQSTFAYY